MELVSVVIPTRDRREAVVRCIRALAQQDHPNYEIIVVDDGSVDGTPDVLRRCSAEYPDLKFRWIRSETHLGANGSRNRGIQEARGNVVAFIDSDCVAAPDWLKKLVAGFDDPRVGAVAGLVETPPPSNIYELTYRGNDRVHGSPYVARLIGCNMAIRCDLLRTHPLDQDLKYGCDEEGIYVRLRAAGYDQKFVPDAKVVHEHRFDRRSLFRQACRGGAGAAWLVYKYHLPPRLDLLPFILMYLTLPLVLLNRLMVLVPLFFLAAALVALAYNELFRKRKTLRETIRIFPVLLAYYQVRLFGYVRQALSLRLGTQRIERCRLRRG